MEKRSRGAVHATHSPKDKWKMAVTGAALLPSFTPLSPDDAAPPAGDPSVLDLGRLAAVEGLVQGQVREERATRLPPSPFARHPARSASLTPFLPSLPVSQLAALRDHMRDAVPLGSRPGGAGNDDSGGDDGGGGGDGGGDDDDGGRLDPSAVRRTEWMMDGWRAGWVGFGLVWFGRQRTLSLSLFSPSLLCAG